MSFIDGVLQVLTDFLNTFGSIIVIPIILFIISLAFGIKRKNALQSALYAGIGLTGFAWLVTEYSNVITPVVQNMVELTGINLPIIDMGWQVTAIVAYSTEVGMIYLGLGLVFQLVLFIVGWTNVFQPSGLWDLYSYAMWGSLIYIVSNDMWLAIAAMLTMNLWATTFYEILAKRWSKYYGYPNCTIVQLHNVDAVPFAIFSNWILNKIGANKIHWNPENLRDKLGFLGDPIILGAIIGLILGILGNLNVLGTMAGWGSVAVSSMSTAAVMAIFPRVASVFAQAFTHLAAASRKIAKSNGRKEEIYIGVDDASGYGESATLISGIIMMPIMLLLAVVIPGNRMLPLVDLVAIPFAIQSFIAFSNGNIFKVLISAPIWTALGMVVASAVSPVFSDVYASVVSGVEPGSLVSSFVIMSKPLWGGLTLSAMNNGWIAVIIAFVLYWPVTLWFKKNKTKVTAWLEDQALLGSEE